MVQLDLRKFEQQVTNSPRHVRQRHVADALQLLEHEACVTDAARGNQEISIAKSLVKIQQDFEQKQQELDINHGKKKPTTPRARLIATSGPPQDQMLRVKDAGKKVKEEILATELAERQQRKKVQQAMAQAEAREYEERMRLHNHQLAMAAHQARWRVVHDERLRVARKAEEAAAARRRKASEAAQKRIVEAHRKMADSYHQALETSRKARPTPLAAFNTPKGRFEYAQLRTKGSPRYVSPRSSSFAAEAEARTPRKPLFAPPSPITTEAAGAE